MGWVRIRGRFTTTHALGRLGPLVRPAAHPPARRGRRSRGRPLPLVEEELVRPRRRRSARLEGAAESEIPKIEVTQLYTNSTLPQGTVVLLALDLGWNIQLEANYTYVPDFLLSVVVVASGGV